MSSRTASTPAARAGAAVPAVASRDGRDDGAFLFRLYVSGATPASARAVVNIRKFCERHLPRRYRLEILNISEHVDAATRDQIIASPTLVKLTPAPVRRFIGDLSDTSRILAGLNLPPAAEP